DAERPADHSSLGACVIEGNLLDRCRGYSGLRFGALEGVGLNAASELLITGRRAPDELRVVKTRMDDLARHCDGQRDVAPDIDAEPPVGPLGGARAPRVDRDEARTVAHAAQEVMEEARVGLACVR